jgi:hypothetical protein
VRGDPQIELRGVVLVGRRPTPSSSESPPPKSGKASKSKLSSDTVEIHGLSLKIGASGLVVEGPHPGVVNTVNWKRIGTLDVGAIVSLADGSPARSLELELDDRAVRFLVPVTDLDEERLGDLIRLRDANLAREQEPAIPPVAETPVEVTPGASTTPVGPVPPKATPPAQTPPSPGPPKPAPRGVLLPPAPPSSKVAMPPAPSQVESSTSEGDGASPKGSNVSKVTSTVDGTLLRPIAVPSATRVRSPRNVEPESVLATVPEVAAAPSVSGGSLATATATPPGFDLSVPAPDPLADTHFEDVAAESSGASQNGSASGVIANSRPERTPRRRRRTTLAGIVGVVLAVAGTAIGLELAHHGGSSAVGGNKPGSVATKSSSGGSTPVLYGPGPHANSQTVASVLNIDLSELPSGWHSGSAPWRRVSTLQSNSALAACFGIPPEDLGIVTGTTAPSGQTVVSSRWATDAPRVSTASTGFTGFESAVVLMSSESIARSDVDALDGSKAPSCLQGWFASLDESGDQIVGVPLISRFSPSVGSGEIGAGFHVSIVTGSTASPRPVDEDLVIVSAGRIEVALVGQALNGKVSSAVEASLISGISNRLAAEAAN